MMIWFAKVGKTLNGLLLFSIFFLTIFAIAGCGGYEHIPEASVLSDGKLTLSWKGVPGATSYDLYISTSPGVTTLNSYKISGVTTPMNITDLEPGTTYYFMVMVYNDSGESRNSKEVSYTVDKTEGWVDFGDLLVSDEPTDQAPPEAIAPAASVPKGQSSTPKTPGTSGKTGQSAVRKPAPAPTPKAAPAATQKASQAAQSSAADTRDVTLAWENVPGATSYNIYWSDNPGVSRRNGTKVGNVKNPHQFKGLIKGKKYYFVVTAVNASGESKESEEFSFTVGK